MPGRPPSLVSTSLWHTPHASTRIRTWPAPGCGISRSTISKSAPAFGTCTAFIFAIGSLLRRSSSSSSRVSLWLIRPGHGAHANGDSIPDVDRSRRPSQVDQFLLGELLPRLRVEVVGHPISDVGEGFSPSEGRSLAIAEERRLPPGVQGIDPLLSLAARTGVLRVHVDAEAASVHLRCSDLDQFEEGVFQ